MSINSKMTAIANKIRALLGITGTMGLDAMASNIGQAQEEVDGQAALIAQIRAALTNKTGGTAAFPGGIIALNTGSFQNSSDAAEMSVPHGLPVEPNFFAVYVEPDFNADNFTDVLVSAFAMQQNIVADGEQLPASFTALKLDAAGYFVADLTGGPIEKYFSDSHITFRGPLALNVEYRWVAIRFDYSV